MSDFTPDELMTIRVAVRKYQESMRSAAIQFASDPDMADYFAGETETATDLWNKLVQMDLRSIRAAREALADAVMKDDPDYREETRTDRLRTVKRQYTDRPMHGPF